MTQGELQELLDAAGEEPVLVGFGATWSGPWKLLAKELDLLEERGNRVIRIDVDKSFELADTHAVVSVPTFVVFAEGRELRRYLGAVASSELEAGMLRGARKAPGRSGMRRRR